MGMRVDTNTLKFSDIMSERRAGGAFDTALPGEKHLRLKDGDLHTHRTDKMSGIHFIERAKKHAAAADAVKLSIDRELGKTGAGDEIFKQLGIGKKVAISDLGKIQTEINAAKKARAKDEMPGLIEATAGQIGQLKQRMLGQMAELSNVPKTDLASAHTDRDWFRAISGEVARFDALNKLQEDGVEGLDGYNAAVALKQHLETTPTMPADKFAELAGNEHVSDAVGYFTAANTVGKKVVARDSDKADPGNMKTAAEKLRKAIDATLTSEEKAALKERVELVRDLATVSQDKVGRATKDSSENDVQWSLAAKSYAVSYSLVAGNSQESIAEASGFAGDDKALQKSGFAARDLVTALAIHYDTIFND